MSDSIKVKHLKVYVQENGIIRLDSSGYLIGRLNGTEFNELENLDNMDAPKEADSSIESNKINKYELLAIGFIIGTIFDSIMIYILNH